MEKQYGFQGFKKKLYFIIHFTKFTERSILPTSGPYCLIWPPITMFTSLWQPVAIIFIIMPALGTTPTSIDFLSNKASFTKQSAISYKLLTGCRTE